MSNSHDLSWTTVKIGDLLAHRKERARPTDPLLSVTSDRGVVPQAESGRRDVSSTNKWAYWRVYPGDIVYNTMRMWQGVSARSEHFGIVSPAYTVCTPVPGADTRFLSYALKRPELVAVFKNRSQGLVSDTWNLKYRSFAEIPIAVPGHSEQRRIAEVLGAVDETISSTELLIAKLERTKQGLLHDLLIYGVNNDGCLRNFSSKEFQPSSLGSIPPSWKVAELGSLGQQGLPVLKTGPFGSSLKGDDWTDSGIPVITIGSLGEGFLDYSELLFISERKAAVLDAYRVKEGEIVFSRVADVGRSVVIRPEHSSWVMSSNLMKITLESKISYPDYVQLALAYDPRVRRRLRATVNSSGRDVVSGSILRSLLIPLPPVEEQIRISSKVSQVQTLIEIENNTLAKHRSLKQGLMDDLLTGRIRVDESI